MFVASTGLALFDDRRIPYTVADGPSGSADFHHVELPGREARLLWPTEGVLAHHARPPRMHFLGDIPVMGRVLSQPQVHALARRLGGAWEAAEPLTRPDGSLASAILRSRDGSTVLPFDPNELTLNLRGERYLAFGLRGRSESVIAAGRAAYYSIRPFLPRRLQVAFRRSFSRFQQRRGFPRWPSESAADDLNSALLRLVVELVDGEVPYLAPWPQPWTWALVLTHDVEGRRGYELLDQLLEIELQLGFRSSWNFVPCNGYVVERRVLDRLVRKGFEIGVHGLFHDGRDIAPGTFASRAPAIRAYAQHWQAVGFRSPGTIRSTELLPQLGFEYDSSFADTAPFEPQAGGCCTWFPFQLGDLVELPITLEQDHTLFDLLQHRDEGLWREKTELVRAKGGMALLLTHPDYALNPRVVHAYRRFLDTFADDGSAWKALPREVNAWWRRRMASQIVEVDGAWTVVGPAAGEARIELATPDHAAV